MIEVMCVCGHFICKINHGCGGSAHGIPRAGGCGQRYTYGGCCAAHRQRIMLRRSRAVVHVFSRPGVSVLEHNSEAGLAVQILGYS